MTVDELTVFFFLPLILQVHFDTILCCHRDCRIVAPSNFHCCRRRFFRFSFFLFFFLCPFSLDSSADYFVSTRPPFFLASSAAVRNSAASRALQQSVTFSPAITASSDVGDHLVDFRGLGDGFLFDFCLKGGDELYCCSFIVFFCGSYSGVNICTSANEYICCFVVRFEHCNEEWS